jgi:hypothetical protein
MKFKSRIILFFLLIISTNIFSIKNLIKNRLIISYSVGIAKMDLGYSSVNNEKCTLKYLRNGFTINYPIPTLKYRVYNELWCEAGLISGFYKFQKKKYLNNIQINFFPDFIIESSHSGDNDFFIMDHYFGLTYKILFKKFSIEPKLLYSNITFNSPKGYAILKQKYSNNKIIYYWDSNWYNIPHSMTISTQFNYQLHKHLSISVIISKSFQKLKDDNYTIRIEDIFGNVEKYKYDIYGSCSSLNTLNFSINYSF